VAITAENVARGTTVELTSPSASITEVSLANWRDVAACRDTDPDLFFPVGTTGPAVDQISAAKIVCEACPAKQPCLEFALISNQDSGVWGGTSEDERRKLRRAWVKSRRAS
jgi:WhiB family transcriptional regulator, redox-sensing transcriptional regulator